MRLSEEIGRTLSLPDVLQRICRVTATLARCDRCAIYLWNPRREAFVPAADHGTPSHLVPRFADRSLLPGRLAFERELNAGETIVLSRHDACDTAIARSLDEAELHALAVVPLLGWGSTTGFLTLGLHAPPVFGDAALDVARDVARQAGQLIENARLFRKLEKAAAFRARVAELAVALNAWNDRTVIARLVCKRGAELFDVDSGVFYQRAGDALVPLAVTGPAAAVGTGTSKLPLDDETKPVVKAFREARPIFANDVSADGCDPPSPARELGLASLLAVPFVGSAGTAGCLVYGDTKRAHPFTQAIADEGTLLAAVATGAIERAQAAELMRRATELLEARNTAVAAAEMKAAFLANMSHEIRTPMTAMLGYLNLLAQPGIADGERHRHMATIRRNGEHLLRIVNDILDLSKIEAGKMAIERAACSPAALLGEIVSLMHPRAAEKGLEFVVECRGPIPDRIHADATRVRQILINLVGNAIKFTDAGEVRLRISLADGADAARPMLRFDVVDTGIGLSRDAIARLFTPFTQADASMARRFGGTGLGLAISKRLAQLLGGDIAVEGEPGRGSVFTVTIETGSLDGVRMLDDPDVTAIPAPAAPVGGWSVGAPLRARVLLAEDTPDIQRLFRYYLTSAGVEVDVAENGIVACDRAVSAARAGHPFDVILMDMQMPELDGERATMRLRAAGYAGVVIALTAHAMQSEREKCLAAGCDDFLSKPTDPATLIETIRRHVDRSRSVEPSEHAESEPIVSTLTGGAELMGLLQTFVDTLPERADALEAYVARGDVDAIAQEAHRLKGTAASYGFLSIANVAARLEKSAPSDPVESLGIQVAELAALCRRARAARRPSTDGSLNFDAREVPTC